MGWGRAGRRSFWRPFASDGPASPRYGGALLFFPFACPAELIGWVSLRAAFTCIAMRERRRIPDHCARGMSAARIGDFMLRFRSSLAYALCLLPSLACAHHGQDFLLLESPGVPHPRQVYLLANTHAALEGDAEEQAGLEPALLIGLSPRVAFELHAHMEKLEGEDWNYEATAPSVHVLLTDPANHHGLKVGLSAEYEIASEDEAPDNAEVRLSFENSVGAVKWGANLVGSREERGEADWGAVLGMRRELRPGFALGVEGQGSFKHAAGGELLAGAYFEHGQSWALKLGVGGVREEDGHVTPLARVGLVLRLKD